MAYSSLTEPFSSRCSLANVADTIAAEEAYEASLDDKDRAYIAYVDTFIRRQQRRNSKRQWGC